MAFDRRHNVFAAREEVTMGRPQVSFAKRQREQAKKEKQQLKAEKRAQRKSDGGAGDEFETPVRETPLTPSEDPTQTR